MHSNRSICFSLLLGLMAVSGPLSAALNFQQEVTYTSFKSGEDSKDMANQFVRAAEEIPTLKVVNVRYEEEKVDKDVIAYSAIITCHVAEPDKDVLRVEGTMLKNMDNLSK